MIVAIRTTDETDDAMHPVPGIGTNAIVLHEDDGSNVLSFPVRAIELTEIVGDSRAETVLKLNGIKATAYVTDSRFALSCSNYDKGGGWIGGAGAIALNAGSKLMAAMRSRGKSLTGQIRYAWLSDVGGHTKVGWADDESLLFITSFSRDGKKTRVRLELSLPKDVDSNAIAADIARRAARYRANAGEVVDDPDEEERLAALREARPLISQKGKYALHTFPTYWPVHNSTVDLKSYLADEVT